MERWRADALGLSTVEQHEWKRDTTTAAMEASTAKEKADADRREALRKIGSKADTFRSQTNVALKNVSKAKALLKLADPNIFGMDLMTGRMGQIPQSVDMNRIRDEMEAALTQVKSNIALGTMAEMKAQSPTGATGFGSMQKNELDLITGALGSLDTELNTTSGLLDSLNSIESVLTKASSGFVPGDTAVTSTDNAFGVDSGVTVIFLGGDQDDPDNWEVIP